MILFRIDITERDISPSDSPSLSKRFFVTSCLPNTFFLSLWEFCFFAQHLVFIVVSEEPFAHRGLPPSTVDLYCAKFCRVLARSFSRTKHVLY